MVTFIFLLVTGLCFLLIGVLDVYLKGGSLLQAEAAYFTQIGYVATSLLLPSLSGLFIAIGTDIYRHKRAKQQQPGHNDQDGASSP